MRAIAKVFIKIIAIPIWITCMTACGGSNSDVQLPLNTQTLEGIWMLKSMQTGSYRSDETNTNLNSVREVYQFVYIIELADGSYFMPECGLDLLTHDDYFIFAIEGSSDGVLDSQFSYQIGEDQEIYSPYLVFENNVKFSGSIDVVNQNGEDLFTYQDIRHANISAIKVSGSRDFHTSNELAIEFSAQLNSGIELALMDIDSDASCMTISSSHYSGMKLGLPTTIEQETMIVLDHNGKEASFSIETGNFGEEVIDHKTYTSSMASLFTSGAIDCADSDDACIDTKSLSLTQSSISKNSYINGIRANAVAVNENEESLRISFSIEIK